MGENGTAMRLLRVIGVLFGLFLAAAPAAEAADVTGIRVGDNSDRTRFVIEMSAEAEYSIITLANPYRMVIDFSLLDWKIPERTLDGSGLIADIRYGRFSRDTSRVVLDLTGPAEAAKVFVLPPQGNFPYRFVVDLKKTSRSSFMASINKPSNPGSFETRSTVSVAKLVPERGGKKVIVVDAGHGGIDPGTLGVVGPDEKYVTLQVARQIKRRMEATGRYSVVLTRDSDILLPLRERFEVARRLKADLFISVHADSIKNRRVRGATVYTLSETASDKEAAALAAKENRADIIAGVNLDGESDDVRSILIDLAQRETMNYSAEFAQFLVPEIGRHMTLRTNSHRFAGFAVLKAPDVPSVLVEMGFLSNAQDARFMYSKDGQRRIAQAIVRAADAYFSRFES